MSTGNTAKNARNQATAILQFDMMKSGESNAAKIINPKSTKVGVISPLNRDSGLNNYVQQ